MIFGNLEYGSPIAPTVALNDPKKFKNMKNTFLIFSICLMANSLFAQDTLSNELRTKFFNAFVSNNMNLWTEGTAELKKSYEQSKSTAILYELAKAEFGSVNSAMGNKMQEKAEEHLAKAKEYTLQVLKADEKMANAHALLSGIYGMEIGFSPMKGMTLGSKSNKAIKTAFKLDPNNAFAFYQQASSYLHTPAMFGGSIKKAISYYQKSVDAFENSGQDLKENWLYLSAMTWLGIAYQKNEQYAAAKKVFEKALAYEPYHGWVKYKLLPSVEKSLAKKN